MSFSKSTAFLRRLQRLRKEAFKFKKDDGLDKELKDLLEASKEKVYITPDLLNYYDFQHLNLIIDTNVKRIQDELPPEIAEQVRGKVAIGGMEMKNINAAIVKDPQNEVFAVLVNYGLVLYLLKFFSYVFAATDQSQVIWCDKLPKDRLNPIDIMKFTDELATNYREHGLAFGPRLLLTRALVDDITYYTDLSLQFVICHELAHYLNGDCECEFHFAPNPILNETLQLEEEIDQEMEIHADLTGFDLLKRRYPDLRINLHGLYLFFIAMDWLYKRPVGQSHPNPVRRYRKIIEQNYDEETLLEFEKFMAAFTILE